MQLETAFRGKGPRSLRTPPTSRPTAGGPPSVAHGAWGHPAGPSAPAWPPRCSLPGAATRTRRQQGRGQQAHPGQPLTSWALPGSGAARPSPAQAPTGPQALGAAPMAPSSCLTFTSARPGPVCDLPPAGDLHPDHDPLHTGLGPWATLGSLPGRCLCPPPPRSLSVPLTRSSPKAAGQGPPCSGSPPLPPTNEAPPTRGPLLGSGLPDPEVTVAAVDATND